MDDDANSEKKVFSLNGFHFKNTPPSVPVNASLYVLESEEVSQPALSGCQNMDA